MKGMDWDRSLQKPKGGADRSVVVSHRRPRQAFEPQARGRRINRLYEGLND